MSRWTPEILAEALAQKLTPEEFIELADFMTAAPYPLLSAVSDLIPSLTSRKTNGQKTINLNELQEAAIALSELLKDRQPGLATWHEALRDKLLAVKKLIVDAGL